MPMNSQRLRSCRGGVHHGATTQVRSWSSHPIWAVFTKISIQADRHVASSEKRPPVAECIPRLKTALLAPLMNVACSALLVELVILFVRCHRKDREYSLAEAARPVLVSIATS